MTSERETNELIEQRRDNLSELSEKGYDPFSAVKFAPSHKAEVIHEDFSELEGGTVALAGRIMAVREHGKACFMDLLDMTGKIQLFFSQSRVGEEAFAIATENLDLGDFVGVCGEVFKTRRGEVSVNVDEFQPLAKALRPLPEKWHGLQDVELRYRQRYLDLLVNPEVKKTFILRSRIVSKIREFLDRLDFLEVETPVLTPLAGGANARPFITHHNTLDKDFYLKISPELYLKRLIVGGFERIYEIGKIFRNEGISTRHNPEFTMIELYQAYADYEDMMELTENMIGYVAREILGMTALGEGEAEIDLASPWKRMRMIEAVKEYTGFDFTAMESDAQARKAACELGLEVEGAESRGEILNLIFEERVEDELIQPTFILDYPVEVSPLAKRRPDESGLTYRFELFINGSEIANAFSELNDPQDQRQRFLAQAEASGCAPEEVVDEDFLRALEYGMPPTGGLGIGIDRLVMVMTDCDTIRDVILFPQMRGE